MPTLLGRTLLPAAILLVGFNLRPLLASVGPLLDAIQRDTALGDTGASLLTSLPVMLMGVCLIGTARLQALLGTSSGIFLGILLIALACLGRLFWPDAPVLIATAVLGGIGIASVQALMPAVIQYHYGVRAAGMMGLYSTAIMGGALLASFVSPRIAPLHGWPTALGLWGGLALLALGLWQVAGPKDAGAGVLPPAQRLWRTPRVWTLLLFFGLGTGAYTLVLAWLPPYYTRLGWSGQAAGTLLSLVTLTEVVAGIAVSLWVGAFHDRRILLFPAIAALLAGLLCLALAPLALAWLAAILAGLGIGALFPLSLIVAMDHGDDPAQAGQIVGFVQGGGYLLAALLPFVAGVMRERLADLAPAWWLMIGLCVLLVVLAARLCPGERLFYNGKFHSDKGAANGLL
ncbi:MAG: MFS transporter [Tsuneonella suprasediminis]|nr:MFS transporter [Altererythrobacter sp. N1]